MKANFSSVSFKRMYPEDYAEITGKTPHYNFCPKDSNGNAITSYYDDCIKKYESAHKITSKSTTKRGGYFDDCLKRYDELMCSGKATPVSKKKAVKLSFIQRIFKIK